MAHHAITPSNLLKVATACWSGEMATKSMGWSWGDRDLSELVRAELCSTMKIPGGGAGPWRVASNEAKGHTVAHCKRGKGSHGGTLVFWEFPPECHCNRLPLYFFYCCSRHLPTAIMPSNAWNSFLANKRPSAKLQDEEAASKETISESSGQARPRPPQIATHPVLSHSHRREARKSTIINPFHRDAFSNRLLHFKTLPDADGQIRFGNKIALKQVRSGKFLHADKDPTLTQNGALAVSMHTWKPRDDDYWIVLPQLGQTQQMGKHVHYNRTIRLQHSATTSNLHTYRSGEITLIPNIRSDTNDVWIVEVFNFSKPPKSSTVSGVGSPSLNHNKNSMDLIDFWHVDDVICLKHHATKLYLTGRPAEVSDKKAAEVSDKKAAEVSDKKGLIKAVALELCDMEGAWRVAVSREDSQEIQTTATMEVNNPFDSITVEQASAVEAAAVKVELLT
ncbi:hypothetical protein BC936DRAFT_140691 [Jimgerdemannia flammicorona]|uniref:MIR domain-containing protein n=1 Tax=Jimgerdemannia flammicorona TaxID=994334 RepID=A0A433AEN0_9FUNG|nr:hypothetical protein BC936DRAFT_140691 [Jimgerdemannia flammicorona]